MAVVGTVYGLHLDQPWWLLACALAPLLAWWAWKDLAPLGRARRLLAVIIRCLGVVLLAIILAGPSLTSRSRQLTVLTVFDRSLSVPQELQDQALGFLSQAMQHKQSEDLVAVVDVAEAAAISKLPMGDTSLKQRNTSLAGTQTLLASGVEMAMAIAPPESASRILLISDGKETGGDLLSAARSAAANGIPIDVLPLKYQYQREVVFKGLSAPVRARSNQTIPLRMVLSSTTAAKGQILLTLNGRPVDLDPTSPGVGAAVELKPGTNVKVVSLPVGTRGVHEFEATFIPDDPNSDRIAQNNHAGAVTFVAGPGHVLVVAAEEAAGRALAAALQETRIDARAIAVGDFPATLANLMDCDALILANLDSGSFTYQQQEMLCRYVTDMGGGLVMTGGPSSFGAGGWIGSPLAEVLPVDLDPPQKKQMPKGALVLIMHACEMPQGNYWNKQVAVAAISTLSRLDLAGILEYKWDPAKGNWVYPLSEVGDKKKIIAAINQMELGDMPDFGPHVQAAYDKLSKCGASAKHIIIISDGDPQPPSPQLLTDCRKAGITISGVCVFPHGGTGGDTLKAVAQSTGGRYYDVKDPKALPQIFIKEAQVVRRALIVEEKTTPAVTFGMHEILRGVGALPQLDGYVLTGPKGGLAQTLLAAGPEHDPLLAAGQSGLGRCVAFTSSADSRWAASWLAWGGYGRFWEQVVRWAGKPAQGSDCEVMTDVQGRDVTLTVEAAEGGGAAARLTQIGGQVIAPDMTTQELALAQVGPGRYRANFRAEQGGCYLFNLRYRKAGGEGREGLMHSAVVVPHSPEFHDLSDNTPLLMEVASLTGGRVISSNPEQADLFNRRGVRFPQSALPLAAPMLLVWLGVFLLDVSVRRLALDFRAIGRRVAAALPKFRRVKKVGATLEGLQSIRQKHLEQLAARRRGAAAPPATAPLPPLTEAGEDVPLAESGGSKAPSTAPAAQAPKPQPPAAPVEETPLQKLLRAKKDAQDRRRKTRDGP